MMLSRQILFSLVIEFWLVFVTVLLLAQPRFLGSFFGESANNERSRLRMTISGVFLLCVTFCWSVVFGCVIAFQRVMQGF